MADQAQGLRALANQARRDHSRVLIPSDDSSDCIDILNPVAAVDARFMPTVRDLHSGASSSLEWMSGLQQNLDEGRSSSTLQLARVVAITSGKGGVGKTNFCSNLALTLAARGQRVIVVDADLGLANVHVVMGVAPRFHLEHVMNGEKTLSEVLYTGPGGVGIIAGGSGLTDLANLDEERRQRFIRA